MDMQTTLRAGMTDEQRALWERLESFALDDPDAPLPFTLRLARDNAWTPAFARRVVDAYRRFLFLAMEAGHPVTPSDEVDQAWHLHMVYTRSYWLDLCACVLQRPLHHGPTRGGAHEGRKFDQWYARTLDSHRRFFGEPDPEVWPPSHVRFGRAARAVRVNLAQNWVVPKRAVKRAAGATALAGGALALAAGCAATIGVPGATLATIDRAAAALVALGVSALVVVVWLVSRSRPARRGDAAASSGCGGYFGFGCSGTSHPHEGAASDSGADATGGSGAGSGCSSGCGGSGCGGGGCGN